MRVLAVSVASLGLLAVLAPIGAVASDSDKSNGKQKIRVRLTPSSATESPKYGYIDFEDATLPQKIMFFARMGEVKAAVEHFLAMPRDESKGDFYGCEKEVYDAYARSMVDWVTFYGRLGDEWEDFTPAQKTRAFWSDKKYDDVVTQYEAAESCKTDSRATAAYLDAKLKIAERLFNKAGGA